MTSQARPLRIALLTYKGNPFCGGQGVYVRHLARELAALGHRVEVIGAQPYPVLDSLGEGVTLTELPSLDLYRQPDPFRTPRRGEYRDWIDALEVATMWTGGFPEPLTFSLRARRLLAARRADFDIVHDNQTLGYGLLGLDRLGLPLVTTVHHPITVDRRLDLAAAADWKRRLSVRRWYGFTRMQKRVARRLPSVLTVSGSSREEIVRDLGVPPERVHTVPIGADTRLFSPDPAVPKVPGRIVTTSSADVPLKGLVFLVRALAGLRARRPEAHLVVVGTRPEHGPVADAITAAGLGGAVEFVKGISDQELADLLRGAEVACVPSLYEGFSLPAAEAMATGTPLVATTGGAVPEVAGPDGETCLAVPPGDAAALCAALDRLLGDPLLRRRLGTDGRARVLARFTWPRAAALTAAHYYAALAPAARTALRASDRDDAVTLRSAAIPAGGAGSGAGDAGGAGTLSSGLTPARGTGNGANDPDGAVTLRSAASPAGGAGSGAGDPDGARTLSSGLTPAGGAGNGASDWDDAVTLRSAASPARGAGNGVSDPGDARTSPRPAPATAHDPAGLAPLPPSAAISAGAAEPPCGAATSSGAAGAHPGAPRSTGPAYAAAQPPPAQAPGAADHVGSHH